MGTEKSPLLEPRVHGADEDDQWAANPWQAQADAHLMQLSRGLATFALPGQAGHVPQVALVAMAPHVEQRRANKQLPAISSSSACSVDGRRSAAPVTSQSSTDTPAADASETDVDAAAKTHDELLANVRDLEWQVAVLEEAAVRKDSEFRELLNSSTRQHLHSGADFRAEVQELKKQNEFLAGIVSRFERKTMHLQGQIDARGFPKREDSSPIASCSGSKPQVDAATADSSIQSASSSTVEQRLIVDLEGQVASLQETIASKDRQLAYLQDSVVLPAEDAQQARREAEHMKERLQIACQERDFAQGLVDRYERKVMEMQAGQTGDFARATSDLARVESELQRTAVELCVAEKRVEEQSRELVGAREEAQACQRLRAQAETSTAQLVEHISALSVQVDEQRDAARNAGVLLREARQQHNQKQQELLRRVQVWEARAGKAEAEQQRLEAVERRRVLQRQEEAAQVSVAKVEQASQSGRSESELSRWRDLNGELLKKLQAERVVHGETREHLAVAVRREAGLIVERDALEARVLNLVEQLNLCVEENDALVDCMEERKKTQTPPRSNSPLGAMS